MLSVDSWKPEVDDRYHYLVAKAATYQRGGGDPDALRRVRAALEAADDLRRHHETFGEWWSGSLPEAVWAYLHDAERELIAATPDTMVSESVRAAVNHVALARYEGAEVSELIERPPADASALRRLSSDVLARCHEVTDAEHRHARRSRNACTLAAAVLLAGAVAFTVVEGVTSGALLPDPSGTVSASVLVALVFAVGAIGGLVSAVALEKRDPTVAASTDRYSVSGPVTALKAAAGAWAALFGAWVTGSGVIGLDITTVTAALLVALAFGLAQEPLTRYLTKWAVAAVGRSGGERASTSG